MTKLERSVHRCWRLASGITLAIVISAVASPAKAQKTDTVSFKNGDRLTVEITKFNRGLLVAKTTGFGTVNIEWDVIESFTTDKTYRVELASGENVLGTIRRAEGGKNLVVKTDGGVRSINFANVASMTRIYRDSGLLDKFVGSVQLGMNYASGSKIGQGNVGFNATLNEQRYSINTSFNATVTTGSSTTDTRRYDWTSSYTRLMSNRWLWLVNAGLSSNDELGIDLRVLGGGGFGRYLKKNNSTQLLAAAGPAASRERRSGEAGSTQLEGQLIGRYSKFLFAPKKPT